MPTPTISSLRAPASSSTSPTMRRGERDGLGGGEVGVQLRVALREHRVGEVGDGDPQVALAEVQPEREAGVPVQRQPGGRPAHGAAGARLLLSHQAVSLQFGDHPGDGGGRERGAPREVRP